MMKLSKHVRMVLPHATAAATMAFDAAVLISVD
jgi:hypothetical protein